PYDPKPRPIVPKPPLLLYRSIEDHPRLSARHWVIPHGRCFDDLLDALVAGPLDLEIAVAIGVQSTRCKGLVDQIVCVGNGDRLALCLSGGLEISAEFVAAPVRKA